METINGLKNKEYITINLFGKDKSIYVFSTEDNKYDENGKRKDYDFELNEKEL